MVIIVQLMVGNYSSTDGKYSPTDGKYRPTDGDTV